MFMLFLQVHPETPYGFTLEPEFFPNPGIENKRIKIRSNVELLVLVSKLHAPAGTVQVDVTQIPEFAQSPTEAYIVSRNGGKWAFDKPSLNVI